MGTSRGSRRGRRAAIVSCCWMIVASGLSQSTIDRNLPLYMLEHIDRILLNIMVDQMPAHDSGYSRQCPPIIHHACSALGA